MFHRGTAGRMFSEITRGSRYRPLESNGGRFGALVKKEAGGVKNASPSNPRSIPPSSKKMDGKEGLVPKGTGQRVGSQNSKVAPRNPSNRLGNFGNPPGIMTKGQEGTKQRMGMPGKTPAKMDGKEGLVPKGKSGGKPKKGNMGSVRINTGTPWKARVRDLASNL